MIRLSLSGARARVAVLAAALVASACYQTRWQSLESGSGTVPIEGGRTLFWRSLGHGPDTVLVLHGGVGLHHGYLLQPFAVLADHRTLIFYDMRGRGRSSEVTDSTALTFDQDVADLETVRQHFNLDRMALVGHHWGAAVAALYAARHPDRVRRMLLVSPFPVHNTLLYEMTFMRGDSVHYFQTLQLAGIGSVDSRGAECRRSWSLFFSPWRTDTLTPYERLAPGMCDALPARLARADWIRNQEQRSLGHWVWRGELEKLAVPTLVIEGRGTQVVTDAATRWAEHLLDARVLLLPPPYLFPWVGSPADFRSAAETFLGGSFPPTAVHPPAWKP